MKVLALFLALFALLSGQKQLRTTTYHQKNAVQIAANVGVSAGNSKCTARHIDSNDSQAYLPDSNCTPGVTNADVTQANINSTICVSGYTKTIRPAASFTDQLKLQQIQQYGYVDTDPRDYEEDHDISLELGGNPTDPKNLWPEPHSSTNEKDKVENYLHKEVCDGIITLAQAQSEITKNWYIVYKQIK